jgi:predicted DNA-binding transcriptional regulator YafY
MADKFLRYLMLLRAIPRSPRTVDTRTLAVRLESHGLKVTRRTLQRDLERLSADFPLVCNDRTKPYGWSWVEAPARAERPGLGSERLRSLTHVARDLLAQAPHKLRRSRVRVREMSVVLRFSDRGAAVAAREFCTSHRSTRYESGGVRVEATVRDTPGLRAWLRSLGADVEIVKPARLRAQFRTLAARLARAYGLR